MFVIFILCHSVASYFYYVLRVNITPCRMINSPFVGYFLLEIVEEFDWSIRPLL